MALGLLLGSVVALWVGAAHWPSGRRLAAPWHKLRWWMPALLLWGLALLAMSDWLTRSKFLARCVMPAGLVGLGLLFAGALRWRRWAQAKPAGGRGAWLWTTAFLGYWLASSPGAVAFVVGWQENAAVAQAPAPPVFDAVAVLGGGTSRTPQGAPQLSPSGDRLVTAARLFHRGKTKRILCLGNVVAGHAAAKPIDLAADAARILIELGVPAEALVALPGAANTRQEVAKLARWSRGQGQPVLGLITSAWHMRRALGLATKAGVRVFPVPSDFRSGGTSSSVLRWIPNEVALLNLRLVVWERLGTWAGR